MANKKRLRDAGVSEEEFGKWTDTEINLVNSLPGDLFKLVFSKYVTRTIDVENLCRANRLTKAQCKRYKIFQFIFYNRYGKDEWDRMHSNPNQPFKNDAWFLRAYELAKYVFQIKLDRRETPVLHITGDVTVSLHTFVSKGTLKILIRLNDTIGGSWVEFEKFLKVDFDLLVRLFSRDEYGPRLKPLDEYGLSTGYAVNRAAASMDIITVVPASLEVMIATMAYFYERISEGNTFILSDVSNRQRKAETCINCNVNQALFYERGNKDVVLCSEECHLEYLGNKHRGHLTKKKAREILHDGTVHGHPLTDKQRRFFGYMTEHGE